MRRLPIVALVVLSIGPVVLAPAAQASEYLCNGKAETCKILGSNLAAFTLEDRGLPAAVECPVEAVKSEGTAGPGAGAEITSVAFTVASCVPAAKALNLKQENETNACEDVLNVRPLNLPWKIPISEGMSNDWFVLIESGGKGQPGYEIECEIDELHFDDACLSAVGNDLLVLTENLAAEGTEPALLTTIFPGSVILAPAEAAKCSLGGAEQGFVSGEILLAAWTGTAFESLAIN
jgi:hypothetical protein